MDQFTQDSANKENLNDNKLVDHDLNNYLVLKDKESVTQKYQDSSIKEQQNTMNRTFFIKFLKTNGWDITKLLQWKEWDLLNENEKEELQYTCKMELLLLQAQSWLKEQESRTINQVIQVDQFQELLKYKKFKKWVSNQKFYTKNKNNTRDLGKITHSQTQNSHLEQNSIINHSQISNDLLEQPLDILNYENQVIQDRLIKQEAFINWDILIKKLKDHTYKERCIMLYEKYSHDPLVFIEMLIRYEKEKYFPNLFSHLLFIILDIKEVPQKINLLFSSLGFYNNEMLKDSHKNALQGGTISGCIKKISLESDVTQVLGLLKLIFINKFSIDRTSLNEITKVLKKSEYAWKEFQHYLKESPYQIRSEVVDRLPMDGIILQYSIICLLQENCGNIFIRVQDDFRRYIIDIALYAQECDYKSIVQFVEKFSQMLLSYNYEFQKANFLTFIQIFANELRKNQGDLQTGIKRIKEVILQVMNGIILGKITDSLKVVSCINGDMTSLNNELSKSRSIEIGGLDEKIRILDLFFDINKQNDICKRSLSFNFNTDIQKIMDNVQLIFGRPFHNIQELCIKIVLNIFGTGAQFIQFGLGNGKTLISIALAIVVCIVLKWSTIIVVKSPYLLYRDYKKFKNIIENCNIMSSFQQYIKGGVSFMLEKQFFTIYKNSKTQNQSKFKETFIIIDEFDCIFDDIKSSSILEKFKIMNQFDFLIGLTGSTLLEEEVNCIKEYFLKDVLVFPKFNQIQSSDIIQRRSFISTHYDEWVENLISFSNDTSLYVPVIIALDSGDIPKVKQKFKNAQLNFIDLTDLLKKQNFAEIQTFLDYQFVQKDGNNRYKISIINTELGRGTDFPTTVDIEDNGGNYLILGDIFAQRTKEQILGRICRMKTKGQYQYVLHMKTDGTIQEYKQSRQNILLLNNQSHIERLLTLIRNDTINSERVQQIKPQLYVHKFFEFAKKQNEEHPQYLSRDISFTNKKITLIMKKNTQYQVHYLQKILMILAFPCLFFMNKLKQRYPKNNLREKVKLKLVNQRI